MILISNLEVDCREGKAIYYVMEIYLTRGKRDEL